MLSYFFNSLILCAAALFPAVFFCFRAGCGPYLFGYAFGQLVHIVLDHPLLLLLELGRLRRVLGWFALPGFILAPLAELLPGGGTLLFFPLLFFLQFVQFAEGEGYVAGHGIGFIE